MANRTFGNKIFNGKIVEKGEPVGNFLPVKMRYTDSPDITIDGYVVIDRRNGADIPVDEQTTPDVTYSFSHAVLRPTVTLVNVFPNSDGIDNEFSMRPNVDYLIFDDLQKVSTENTHINSPCYIEEDIAGEDSAIQILKRGPDRCAWVIRLFNATRATERLVFKIPDNDLKNLIGIKIECDEIDDVVSCEMASNKYKFQGDKRYTACEDRGIVGLCQDDSLTRQVNDQEYLKGDSMATSSSIIYGGFIEEFWISEHTKHINKPGTRRGRTPST